LVCSDRLSTFKICYALKEKYGVSQEEYNRLVKNKYDTPWISIVSNSGGFSQNFYGIQMEILAQHDDPHIPLIKGQKTMGSQRLDIIQPEKPTTN